LFIFIFFLVYLLFWSVACLSVLIKELLYCAFVSAFYPVHTTRVLISN